MKITQFFKEGDGAYSSTRFVFMLGSIWNMLFATTIMLTSKEISPLEVGGLYASIQTTLGAIKVFQYKEEIKPSANINN